ncbi:MAG TPA: noncanonical pyrimidine nucleotidase, YjjG family [Bacteroidales bacterium]|nr:noncanonical pyrimidine nucleotidase, YjjG family [Bacteroidales bacterium]
MCTSKYKHLFFDLDRTLWDFDKNSVETLKDIFEKYNLNAGGVSFDSFIKIYNHHNHKLWDLYRQGKIEKDILSIKRFTLTINELNIGKPNIAEQISTEYIIVSPTKKVLFPNTHESLSFLSKNYKLHIITNGFNEVQYTKLENAELSQYFTEIITSEQVGKLKPNSEIFEFALQKADATPSESIMIGDDLEVDIAGADRIGMDTIFFNPEKIKFNQKVTYEIIDLIELKEIFCTNTISNPV